MLKIENLSVASRLRICSFVFTYTLLIGLWCALFWLTKQGLRHLDEEMILDRVKTLSSLLQTEAGPSATLTNRIEVEWFNRDNERVFARLIDPAGNTLVSSPKSSFAASLSEDLNLLEQKIKRRNHPERFESSSHIVEAIIQEVDLRQGQRAGRYLVEVALDRSEESILFSNFTRFFLALLVIGGLASVWIGRVMVRIALRPIRQVTKIAARVNSQRLNERIDIERLPGEFREVAITMNDMLNRLSESFDRLTRFSQDMAHELRTPVNNLLGSMGVGLARERTAEEYKNLLGSGIEECDRLKRIIDSLMFIARTSDTTFRLDRQLLNTDHELADIVSFYELSAEEKNISIVLQGQKQTALLAERIHLQRCIGNLLSNSIRHSPNNSTIFLAVEESESELCIRVIDFGCGMPEAALPRIGERFFRTDDSRSKIYGGTGLGLSIAKSIVEMHGGRMQVQSAIGKGTTIALYFKRPLKAPSPTATV